MVSVAIRLQQLPCPLLVLADNGFLQPIQPAGQRGTMPWPAISIRKMMMTQLMVAISMALMMVQMAASGR
uniref:Uncharacterized protein n=1 Tax=viral metagenome TaxID=1070528 RepID=A0A6M3XE07_9ZZZZ